MKVYALVGRRSCVKEDFDMNLSKGFSMFYGSRALENKIDEFLDRISEAGLIYKKAIHVFLEHGVTEDFVTHAEQIGHIESRADELRREVEAGLYEQNLIPDLRADVLSLVEDLDAILNAYDASGYRFTIEQPVFPATLHPDILAIVDSVTNSVEQITIASRTFFRDFNSCRDYIHKVRFYESEADRISTKIKRAIYSSDLPLANKMHLSSFVEMIDNLADMAEDITDKLAIYVIKRDN